MNILKYVILLLGLSICFIACQESSDLKSLKNLKPKNKEEKKTSKKEVDDAPGSPKIFKLPETSEEMNLPSYLREVSGLSFDASANGLIAHDDEVAILYNIDFDKKEIVSKEKIGGSGDFEGIEKVDDKIYLVKSNGEMIAYDITAKESQKFSTGLSSSNNVEGLAEYNGNLLLACKGKPEKESGQDFDKSRAVYSFNLQSMHTAKSPFMLISEDKLKNYATDASSGEKDRLEKFAPSGIAVHPKTNAVYILSNRGRMLLVTNAQAEIQKIYFLDYQIHKHPEGICFDAQNRMYIANEADGGTAVIYRYSNY